MEISDELWESLKASYAHVDVAEEMWALLPAGSKRFFVEDGGDVGLDRLLEFWRDRRGEDRASKISGRYRVIITGFWSLADWYLAVGNVRAANNLLLGGAWLQYARDFHPSMGGAIDHVERCVRSTCFKYPHLVGNRHAIYQHAVKAFPSLHEVYQLLGKPDEMNCYLSQREGADTDPGADDFMKALTSEWKNTTGKDAELVQILARGDGPANDDIDVVFFDETNTKECKLKIGKYVRLKKLFNDYSEGMGASLRSLRFSYRGRVLFLSSVGNKTPGDLGMEDGATIVVSDLAKTSKKEDDVQARQSSCRRTQGNSSSREKKGRGRTTKKIAVPRSRPLETGLTDEELRIQHSKMLSRLHDEVRPQLKLIRQRLDNLVMERSQPKSRSSRRLTSVLSPLQSISPPLEDLGGKAGRPCFTVQVGEVANLYKTGKRRAPVQQRRLRIDLHGLAEDEALRALDENLPQWREIAMLGSYPFVVAVEIVCGFGGQVLSEAVGRWIKCHDQVANARKNM